MGLFDYIGREDMDDLRAEFGETRGPRPIRCSDRMCGAWDCPNCYPRTPEDEAAQTPIDDQEEQA